MVIFITGNAKKFHGTLHHANSGIAIATHNAITQTTVVGTNAHGRAVLFTYAYQRRETFTDAFDFFRIFRVGVFDLFEFLFINVVAGVHAHFLYDPCSNLSRIGSEMNIRYDRHMAVTAASQFIFDNL